MLVDGDSLGLAGGKADGEALGMADCPSDGNSDGELLRFEEGDAIEIADGLPDQMPIRSC